MRTLQFLGRRVSLEIEPMFWLAMGALTLAERDPSLGVPLARTLVLFAALALSVLLHESGHAAAVLLFGGSARVRLHALGGQTSHEIRFSLPKELAVTAAGPLAGFAGAAVAFACFMGTFARHQPPSRLADFLAVMIRINLIWSAANLLPVLPMDGGRLLSIVLAARFGNRGLKFVYGLGILLGGALALRGLWTGRMFNAAIFGLFAASGVASWRLLARRAPQDDDPALQREAAEAEGLLNEGRNEEALPRLIELRRKTARGVIFEVATELQGRALSNLGQSEAAFSLLASVEERLSYPSRVLLMGLALEGGDHDRALKIGRTIFPMRMDPSVAYLCAAACAGQGDRDGALHWLKAALRGGLPNAARRLAEGPFEALRGSPEFEKLQRLARREA